MQSNKSASQSVFRANAIRLFIPYHYQLVITIALLGIVLAFFEITSADVWVENHFYDFALKTWWIEKSDEFYEYWFHRLPRRIIHGIAIATIITFIASFFYRGLQGYRYRLLGLALAIILVPAAIVTLKAQTHVYCPNQTILYNGDMPYVKLFDRYPKGFRNTGDWRCYPAGHASGGFAFMALFFFFREARRRWQGLAFGISLGWLMGWFQMMRGEHFLSHTVVTMLIGWGIIVGVEIAVAGAESRFPLRASREALVGAA